MSEPRQLFPVAFYADARRTGIESDVPTTVKDFRAKPPAPTTVSRPDAPAQETAPESDPEPDPKALSATGDAGSSPVVTQDSMSGQSETSADAEKEQPEPPLVSDSTATKEATTGSLEPLATESTPSVTATNLTSSFLQAP